MKKLEQHYKKQRNDTDTQVKKYKQDLDAIGIRYDHKSAHVEVPNYATGGFEYFKWDWMTSSTGSHSEIVHIFKKVVSTLKEVKSNPAQYENLVSSLDASTKNAIDVNIKKHNITVPQLPEVSVPMDEITSLLQKYAIGYNEQGVQIQSVNYADYKTPLTSISINDTAFDHAIRAYDAVKTGNQQLFIQNYKELDLNSLVILRNIPFVSHKESNPSSTAEQTAEFIKNSGVVLPVPNEYKGVPTKEVLKYYTGPVGDAVIEIHDTEMARINAEIEKERNNLNITEQEDSDDDIEVISNLLKSEATLTNGKKIEVKKIIDAIYKPKELDFYLKKLTPEDSKVVKKEIALKLAYDFFKDAKEFSEVNAISETIGINEEFNNYSNFNLEQLKGEEVNITGGASYLE